MKRLAVIVAAASIVALAVVAYADMDGHAMGSAIMCGCGMDGQMTPAEHHMSRHLMALDLDEQQKALIGEIKNRMVKETIRRTADMHIAQIDLKDLLSQDPVDMKAVEAKVKQLEMMRTDMLLSHIKAMEDIRTKLTPEQRKKLRQMIESVPMMGGMGMMHYQERCNGK